MQNKTLNQNNKTNHIFLILLLGLVFLRFPFVISMSYNILPFSKELGRYIFQDGTYFLTAILIILKRDTLSNYNMGFYVLLIFIIAPFAKLLSIFAFTGIVLPNAWIQIAISICLLIVLFIYHPKLYKRSIKEILLWLLIAIVVGICSGVLVGIINSLQVIEKSSESPSAAYLFSAFFAQLSNAAVSEEPLFRGFLWGFLKNLHWKDHWILLFQAALFMLGHIYYLGVFNYSFLITVPIGGLVLGLLVWRSKSIGTSMIAHGFINSVADMVANLTW